MRVSRDMVGGCSMLDAWVATRRWTITGNRNQRRVVDTPGHAFVVIERANDALALYKSNEDKQWITIAMTKSVAEAKAALFECALEAQVEWR
jgi:hypothetical protein